jgi:hypothetical protein
VEFSPGSICALAAQTLGQIGADDENVRSALVQCLRDDQSIVRKAAQRALKEIRPVPVITSQSHSDNQFFGDFRLATSSRCFELRLKILSIK